MDTALSNNPPEEDEVTILARRHAKAPDSPRQTVLFTSLPPEIRNRIHALALPKGDEELVVASPLYDSGMQLGVQPALSRTCKQLRAEVLPMFYANSKFVA